MPRGGGGGGVRPGRRAAAGGARPAHARTDRRGFRGRHAPPHGAQGDPLDVRHGIPDGDRHARFGQRGPLRRPVQRQLVEIRPQPRGGEGQHDLRKILGHEVAFPVQQRHESRHSRIGRRDARGLGLGIPLSLQRCGQSARQVRPAPRTAASGRRSAAPHARHDLRHLLRPRAHLANRPGIRQPGHHPP